MKILVPVDLVHPVLPTLDLLKKLMELKNAEIKFLYVREMLPAYENMIQALGTFADDWDRQIDDKARKLLEQAKAHIAGQCKSVDTEIAAGPTAMMIERVAKDEGYGITVLTPGKHNPAERIFSGSVTAKCVAHVPGTVIVARPESMHAGELKRVIIGFDGSHNARQALERSVVQFRIKESDADVVIVHSVDMVEPIKLLTPIEFVSALEQNMLMQGQAFLAEAEKVLKVAGVNKLNCVLIEGDPAGELAKIARDAAADLMVIGAQGHSAIEHFLLGSVSERVAMHAPCSVAVVKPEKSAGK